VQALSHPGSLILEEEAKGSVHAMSLQTLLQHLLIHEENKRKRRKREKRERERERWQLVIGCTAWCLPAALWILTALVDHQNPHVVLHS